MKDEILAELWATKDSIAQETNYDVSALMSQLKRIQSQSTRKVVNLSQNKKMHVTGFRSAPAST
ncbi:MAG: hypothetical protein RRC34_16405 [Lentisphaeria bacterium]|nr:hypothetical protein [Lentisphaeria bacterium]